MILISDKKKLFEISQIGNIHNEQNNYYIHNVFSQQNNSKEYQEIYVISLEYYSIYLI